MQALDVALKHGSSLNPALETVARAFFIRDEGVKSIGNGAEVGLLTLPLFLAPGQLQAFQCEASRPL